MRAGWAGVLGLLGPCATAAQRPTHDYYDAVPRPGRIISQAAATARLHLFGQRSDSAYRDVAPADGIDDARAVRLAAIAEHFSPLLRRNNFSVPRDFRAMTNEPLQLRIDRWVDGKLAGTDSIGLTGPRLVASVDSMRPTGPRAPPADERLAALIRAHDPRAPAPGANSPERDVEEFLYFDFPGHDEPTWRRAHQRHDPKQSTVFAHPFIHDRGTVERPFSLVMQYWLFYPFNDGPNNHEGDWEHITVGITSRERLVDTTNLPGMDAAEVARILGESYPTDSLVIDWVSHYFHHTFVKLDYRSLIRPGCPTACANPGTPPIWEDRDFVPRELKRRVELADGRLATHPFIYVGGNNRGPDEMLTAIPRFSGSYNRNSHGSFPFPSTWRSVGALGATEKIFGALAPRVAHDPERRLPWNELVLDDHVVTYRAAQIVLLPDWERILDLAIEDPDVRRDWGWLMLPARFGYPSSKSPGRGAVGRTDMGNVSPLGPAFVPGWNRPYETPLHHEYEPRVMRMALAPGSPFNGMQNGWGIFNLPVALAGLIPGVQVVTAQLMPWMTGALSVLGAPPGKTFIPTDPPRRITSFNVGQVYQFGGHGLARLLPRLDSPVITESLASDSGSTINDKSWTRNSNWGHRIWMNLHYTDRVAIENVFGIDTTTLSYAMVSPGGSVHRVRGTLASRHLSAGLRVSATPGWENVSIYGRAGYTWTWYQLSDIRVDGSPTAVPKVKGGHRPSLRPSMKWWPNGSYAGVGAELMVPRRYWFLGKLGYGVSTEAGVVMYPLRASRCSCLIERGDASFSIVFGW